MALNDIKFKLGQGGLGRPLPGEDFISGLIAYTNGTLPSGFSSTNRIKQFFSVADAEAAGIKADYADATAATGSYLVTAIGANGDTIEFKVNEPGGVVVSLGVYTKASAASTVALVATAIAAVINAGTINHGYSASVATATVTITAPKRLGLFLNSGTPLSVTLSAGATIAGTLTQFTGGVGSKYAVWHYHISEYFRLQPQGNLYVGLFAVPGSYTFTEIQTVQNFANGKIRQIAVYKDSAAFSTADLTAIDTVCETLIAAHKPLVAFYAGDMTGITDISTLTDLSSLTANNATAIIGQDGAALGAFLYVTVGKSISCLGAALGIKSFLKVSESIANVEKANMSDGTELDVLAFANGVLFSDSTVSDNLLSTLNSYRYVFLRTFVGVEGSYFNDNHTASAIGSNDYAYIDDNQVIQKAMRGVYASVIPVLNSSFQTNADGTLTDVFIAYVTGKAEVNLLQMIRDEEISAQKVVIDPTQDVFSTSKLIIQVQIVKDGVARNIEIPIGYKKSI